MLCRAVLYCGVLCCALLRCAVLCVPCPLPYVPTPPVRTYRTHPLRWYLPTHTTHPAGHIVCSSVDSSSVATHRAIALLQGFLFSRWGKLASRGASAVRSWEKVASRGAFGSFAWLISHTPILLFQRAKRPIRSHSPCLQIYFLNLEMIITGNRTEWDFLLLAHPPFHFWMRVGSGCKPLGAEAQGRNARASDGHPSPPPAREARITREKKKGKKEIAIGSGGGD